LISDPQASEADMPFETGHPGQYGGFPGFTRLEIDAGSVAFSGITVEMGRPCFY